MTVSRTDASADALYFKLEVEPGSDFDDDRYFAGFQLYAQTIERLGVGNAFNLDAYSAYDTAVGDVDLNSSNPEPGGTSQLVRDTDDTTLVFKVQYNAGAPDDVTVWLDPDATRPEGEQPGSLTTTFEADATFDEIRLREGIGSASGWTFSHIVVSRSFEGAVPEPGGAALGSAAVGVLAALARRRRLARGVRG